MLHFIDPSHVIPDQLGIFASDAKSGHLAMAMLRTKKNPLDNQQDEWRQGNRIMPDAGINSRYTDQENTKILLNQLFKTSTPKLNCVSPSWRMT